MKILQNPISDSHLSAMFFDGVVATSGRVHKCELVTYQDGELVYNDKLYVGKEIRELGETGAINDNDIDEEFTVDIHVDKFFAIKFNDEILEEYIFNDFDEAMEAFEEFVEEV